MIPIINKGDEGDCIKKLWKEILFAFCFSFRDLSENKENKSKKD